ncbi:DUF3883 domain-containing protein [Parafannyhessea umbonata]|uniref:DUF3883 domain-containing protein n=1 Tax=Parafannyhessea umbonata TaxID=604330 RepID=UPI003AB7C19C
MLEELTGYSSFGTAFLLNSIIARILESAYSEEDLRLVLSNDVPSMEMIDFPAALALLNALGLLCPKQGEQGCLTASEKLEGFDDGQVVGVVIHGLLELLEPEGVFCATKLVFDRDSGRTYLPLHQFPMKLAPYRNLLVELGGLIREGKRLYLSESVRDEIARNQEFSFDGMTPEQLFKRLEENRNAGEQAELFAMEFEIRRLGENKGKEVQQVSAISVSAGFDIASFESADSEHYDRLIEVKAISRDGFFLSSNELDVAKRQGQNYYLYLVDLCHADEPGYEPTIIRDPADFFSHCDSWRVSPSSYHITQLS